MQNCTAPSTAVAHTVGRARAQIRERDADLYESLEKVGFMHDWGDDDSGLFMKYLRRGSGYYIDVGAVQLLVDGKVKLRSGKGLEIKRFEKNGVELNDGTKLDADLVVLATGYGSMNQWAPAATSPYIRGLAGVQVKSDSAWCCCGQMGGEADQRGGGGQGRQVLGARLRHHQRPRPVGRRAAQHGTPKQHRASPRFHLEFCTIKLSSCVLVVVSGSRQLWRACGSTAATCTSRATTRSS